MHRQQMQTVNKNLTVFQQSEWAYDNVLILIPDRTGSNLNFRVRFSHLRTNPLRIRTGLRVHRLFEIQRCVPAIQPQKIRLFYPSQCLQFAIIQAPIF